MMGGHEQLCLECGEPFTASRSDALTCSNACRSRRGRRLRWRQVGNLRMRTVEAQPDDEMFGRVHFGFFSDPEAPETRGAEGEGVTEHISLGADSPGADVLFWLNDRLGKVVSVSIYAGRGDGPPLLALDAVGELRHKHLEDGSNVYEVGGNCTFELPLDAAEDAKIHEGRLTVDLDLECWITVYAIGADGLPEE
jgi:hypothetical protein